MRRGGLACCRPIPGPQDLCETAGSPFAQPHFDYRSNHCADHVRDRSHVSSCPSRRFCPSCPALPALVLAPPSPAVTPVTAPPVSSPEAPPAAAAGGGGTVRRLEFIEGQSAKFWEIAQNGCSVTVRFGRIGTQGQTQTKTFENVAR